MTSLDKTLITLSTGVRLDSQMGVNVMHKISFQPKLFLAFVTLVNSSLVRSFFPLRKNKLSLFIVEFIFFNSGRGTRGIGFKNPTRFAFTPKVWPILARTCISDCLGPFSHWSRFSRKISRCSADTSGIRIQYSRLGLVRRVESVRSREPCINALQDARRNEFE